MTRLRHVTLSIGGGALWALAAGTILFGVAGRLDLPQIWALLAVTATLGTLTVIRIGPGEVRRRHARGSGDRGRVTTTLVRLGVLATLILGALDAGRLGWSRVPAVLQIVAGVGFAVSLAYAFWAVAVNRYYTHEIRVQVEQNHRVVDAGPYRHVRHPSYLGLLVVLPAAALALGSWWALIPAVGSWLVLIRRTQIEDRMLVSGLSGYADYASRVRYRLVPGLW